MENVFQFKTIVNPFKKFNDMEIDNKVLMTE